MKNSPLIILDLETTGLSPYRHKITEIAAVKIVDNEVVDKFQTLINPEVPIPAFITRLTGISDEMVKDAPVIVDVLPSLKKFLADDVIIAHNASFDFNFLRYNFKTHLGVDLSNPKVCTVKLANRVHEDLPSKKLGFLCEYYGITNSQAHRAMSDVLATKELFLIMREKLLKAGLMSKEDLLTFESLSCQKARSLINSSDS